MVKKYDKDQLGGLEERVGTGTETPASTTKKESASETTPKKEEEMVPASVVAQMKKEMDELREMVRTVSDKPRLDRYDDSKKKESKPIVKISVYQNKPVTAWSDLKTNVVSTFQDKKHSFDQTTELTYLDGETEVVDYQVWQRDRRVIPATVEETKIKDHITTYVVLTDDFGQFEIGQKFIN